jgi:hypothetical protein
VRNLSGPLFRGATAMQMVGYKTEALYRRYSIVSEMDRQEAADKLAAIESKSETGTMTGTVAKLGAR